MDRILLISDNPRRSRVLAKDFADGLTTCEIHDLYADHAPATGADVIATDIHDFSSDAVDRVRRLLGGSRRGAPLFMLLHHDSTRARLFGVALGASHILGAPFTSSSLRAAIGSPFSDADPPALCTLRNTEEARQFYTTVFTPDRPLTESTADAGTDFIGSAVRDTGIRDWVRAVQRFDDATHQHCLLVTGLASAFARINDRYGHDVGDQVIRCVARTLRETGAIAGRLGGEEFAVLMPGHGLAGAAVVAHRIRSQCAATNVPRQPDLHFTASIGLAEWTAGDTTDTLLKRADLALYAAKRGGRNRVAVTSLSLQTEVVG